MLSRTSWPTLIAVAAVAAALLFAHTRPQEGPLWSRLLIAVVAALAAVLGGHLAAGGIATDRVGPSRVPPVSLVLVSAVVMVLLVWIFSISAGVAAIVGIVAAVVVASLARSAKQ